jgi:hypothetical protein
VEAVAEQKGQTINSIVTDALAAYFRRQSDDYRKYFELASRLLNTPEGSGERIVFREQLIRSLSDGDWQYRYFEQYLERPR